MIEIYDIITKNKILWESDNMRNEHSGLKVKYNDINFQRISSLLDTYVIERLYNNSKISGLNAKEYDSFYSDLLIKGENKKIPPLAVLVGLVVLVAILSVPVFLCIIYQQARFDLVFAELFAIVIVGVFMKIHNNQKKLNAEILLAFQSGQYQVFEFSIQQKLWSEVYNSSDSGPSTYEYFFIRIDDMIFEVEPKMYDSIDVDQTIKMVIIDIQKGKSFKFVG